MILSSVNFVNNYKFSDFILDKISEEQNKRDDDVRYKIKRNSLCTPGSPKEADFSYQKRSSFIPRRSGDSPRSSQFTSKELVGANKLELMGARREEIEKHALITIETTDGLLLTADTTSLHITLKEKADVLANNVFRKIDLGPNESGQIVVFQLCSNPSYFVATTHLRHLELQSYCDDTLDPNHPDERFFRCFHTQYGSEVIQPLEHKGQYMHHIDNFIALRKLELNFRPPEEYFFNFVHHSLETTADFNVTNNLEMTTQMHNQSASIQSIVNENEHKTDTTQSQPAIPDISKSSLKRKDFKKAKHVQKVESTITPKSGMLSCFGLGALRRKKDKSKR